MVTLVCLILFLTMQQHKIPECSRINLHKWRKIKPIKDICGEFDTEVSRTFSESSVKDEFLLPKLVRKAEDLTKSVLSVELVHFLAKMDSMYKKFRRSGPKLHRIGMPSSQYFADNFEKIRNEVCPKMFATRNDKCEVLRIINDYDRHSLIIKRIVDSYYAEFIDNAWNIKTSHAYIVTYILLRLLKDELFDDIYNLLNEIAPKYVLLPLTKFLLKKATITKAKQLGLKLFDEKYVETMFSILNNKGSSLFKQLYEKLLHFYFKEYDTFKSKVQFLPVNLEEYLNIQKRKFTEEEESFELSESPNKMRSLWELTEKVPPSEQPVGSLINYKRLVNLSHDEGILTFNAEVEELSGKTRYSTVSTKSRRPTKSFRSSLIGPRKSLKQRESMLEARREKIMQRVTEVLLKFNQNPWSLTLDERKIIERLEIEPEWFLNDDYVDEELSSEEEKGKPTYKITQRRGLALSGVKNRCCIHELEEEKDDFPKLYKREERSLNYLKRMVDFRKNNACVLRQAATLSKEEDEILTEMKKLEGGDIGLLEYQKSLLESEIKDERDKALAIKRKHLLALLSLERALLAKKRLEQKNAELGKMLKEEKKMLNEEQKLLNEQENERKRKLVEDIQELNEKIQDKLQMTQLDNWVEARYINNMLKEMKDEKREQLEKELQQKRDGIEETRALKYLNKKKNVMENPPAKDLLWKVKLPGMPPVAANMELKLAKARSMEELQRKKEAAFQLNAHRKCLKKIAEEYIESRRTLSQKKKKEDKVKKPQVNEVIVKSKELDDLENQLHQFRKLRKRKKPLTESQLTQLDRQKEQSTPPIVDDCLYVEKRGVVLKKIRQPINVIVESKELQQIKKKIKEKKAVAKPPVILKEEIQPSRGRKVKVPPPITSLDTFFANIIAEINWDDEEEYSDTNLHKNKMTTLARLNEEMKIFKESDKIPELVEVIPEVQPVPLLLAEKLPTYIFLSGGALQLKKPFHKPRMILNKEQLGNILDILKLYTNILKVKSRKKSSRDSLFPNFRMDGSPPPEETDDFTYHQNRRFLMLPQEEIEIMEKSDERIQFFPSEESSSVSKDTPRCSLTSKQILDNCKSLGPILSYREDKRDAEELTEDKVALSKSEKMEEKKEDKEVKKFSSPKEEEDEPKRKSTRRSARAETPQSSQAEGRSFKKSLTDESSDDSLDEDEDESGRESSDEKVFDDESFEMPKLKRIDAEDMKAISDEENVVHYYKKVLQFLDLPLELTEISSVNILSLKAMPSSSVLPVGKKPQLSFGIDTRVDLVKTIPSSTALEYILKMHPKEELPKIIRRPLKGTDLPVVVKRKVSAKEDKLKTESALDQRIQKMQELLTTLPKQDPMYQFIVKKLKNMKVKIKPEETPSVSKPIRHMRRNFRKQYLRYLKRIPHRGINLSKPKVYPPFNLKVTASKLGLLGVSPFHRFRNRRLIIPGKCKYIQQQFFFKGQKKKKAHGLKKQLSLTERAKCLREKFEKIDDLITSRFPPPYSTDSIIFEYFPSLKKTVPSHKHREFIESLKQKTSLPILATGKNNLNPILLQKENKSFALNLPSPLGSKTNLPEEKSNSFRTFNNNYLEVESMKSPTKYIPKEIPLHDSKCNLDSYLESIVLDPYKKTDICLMNKQHNRKEENSSLKQLENLSTSSKDLYILKEKPCYLSSDNSLIEDTNSEEGFQYFSLPLTRKETISNSNSKCCPKFNQDKSFLPMIKLSFNREVRSSNAIIKLPPIKKI